MEHPKLYELYDAFESDSPVEKETVRKHVAACPSCRQKVEAFWADADFVMAALAPHVTQDSTRATFNWKWDTAKAERQALENTFTRSPIAAVKEFSLPLDAGEPPATRPLSLVAKRGKAFLTTKQLPALSKSVYLPAAGVLLAFTSGLCGYWWAASKKIGRPAVPSASVSAAPKAAEVDVQALTNDRDALMRQLADRDVKMAALTQSIKQQRAEIDQLRQAELKLEADAQSDSNTKQALASEKEALSAKLQGAQTSLAVMQSDLVAAADRNQQLSASLRDRDTAIRAKDDAIQQQRELLDSDRDVRDLITARNLYVAEVMDIDKKPYARVFFTKDKSLIFYGYDLDKEPGVRNASTFQAWGNRGHNREGALNLGFLYQDSAANKRWALKLDDPKTLAQIDAIFITVEPKGGSAKPTGKSVLFASLRLPPNHP